MSLQQTDAVDNPDSTQIVARGRGDGVDYNATLRQDPTMDIVRNGGVSQTQVTSFRIDRAFGIQ